MRWCVHDNENFRASHEPPSVAASIAAFQILLVSFFRWFFFCPCRLMVAVTFVNQRWFLSPCSILSQHSKPGLELENLEHIQSLRDLVMPNRLIVELADKALKCNGAMLLHLRRE